MLLAAVAVGIAVAGVCVAAGFALRPAGRGLDDIIAPYAGGATEDDGAGDGRWSALSISVSDALRRTIDSAAARAGGTGILQRIEVRLEQADLRVKAEEAVLGMAGLVVVVALAATVAAGPVVGLAGAVAAGLLPAALITHLADRRQRSFVNQLPDALQLVSSALRAGFSLVQALDAVSAEVGDPMARELRRVVLETRLGRPLEEALADTAARMGSADFEWVVIAVGIQREVGGNLAEVLANVAETMVSRERMRREVRALTAEGRMSAIVVGVLPIVVAVAITVLNPGYLGVLFTHSLGKVMLLGAVVLAAVGFVWMRKIIEVDV